MTRTVYSIALVIACQLVLATVSNGQETSPIDLIYSGELDKLNKLLDEGLDPNTKDEFGEPLLFAAVGADEVELAKRLIELGADPNATGTNEKVPVINNACYIGSVELVELLLKKGADPKRKDGYGGNALEDAAMAGSRPLAEKFRKLGLTSKWKLHVAAGLGDLKLVRRLATDAATVNQDRTGWNDTPLVFAAASGHFEVVKLLLERGANPNLPDAIGCFPLHYAAEDGNTEICQFLLDAGADVNAHVGDGPTPLDFADDEKTKKLLKEHSATEGYNLPKGPSQGDYWRETLMKRFRQQPKKAATKANEAAKP